MKKYRLRLAAFLKQWKAKQTNQEGYRLTTQETHAISKQLAPVLSEIFGYHALLYTAKAKKLMANDLIIRHSWIVESGGSGENQIDDSHSFSNSVKCLETELPFSSDSIDLIIVPEVFRKGEYPHQKLREIERVLIPDGQLIMLVENVLSWQSVKERILAFIAKPHFRSGIITRFRLNDWFGLLGLKASLELPIYRSERHHQAGSAGLITKLTKLRELLSSKYLIIVAKKKVSTLTPIRPSWRANRKLVRPRIAEPSVKVSVDKILNKGF